MKKHLTRKNFARILSLLLAILFLSSAYAKLTLADDAVETLSSHNLEPWIFIIGIGELSSIILFLLPWTKRLGTWLLSSYLGGAIMFHMAHTDPAYQNFLIPAIALIVVWATAWLRGLSPFEK